MIPQVDFDIVDFKGFRGLGTRKQGFIYEILVIYKKSIKLPNSGNPKKPIFRVFIKEKSRKSKIAIFPEIAISGNRNLVGLVIASETPL